MALPSLSSAHCYVLNRYNRQELYALDETTSSRIASLTKVMTLCRVVRDRYPRTADLEAFDVTISADIAAEAGDGDVLEDDIWPGNELAKVMMIASSNRGTAALAWHVGVNGMGFSGTVSEVLDDVIVEMNTAATAAGLSVTTDYTSVHGFGGSPFEASTAKDQALLFDQLCTWQVLRDIWAEAPSTSCDIDRGGPYTENISSSVAHWTDTGVIGLKNGIGGGNHMFTLWEASNGNEIVIVTLNASGESSAVTDHRNIITQLPIDYPYLLGPVGTALPAPA